MIPTALIPETEAKKLVNWYRRVATIPFSTHLDADLALVVLNLHDPEDLKKLVDQEHLNRYSGKGRNICYKKSELQRVREAMDRGDIRI